MIRFYLNKIKFLSSTAILVLSCQSLAVANPTIKTQPQKQSLKPNLLAQMFTGNEDVLVPNPTIKIDGKPVKPSSPTPPPFLPRAVAPPVGDMAVSNVNSSIPTIDLGTTSLVPRLVLRDAPVQEVLALLGRAAGLNVIFTDVGKTEQGKEEQGGGGISLDLQNEPIQDVFNSVLMVSGLKANRQGNTLYIGNQLPPMINNTITRSVRLNQYDSIDALYFLHSQGAQGNFIEIEETEEDGKITKTYEVTPLNDEELAGQQLLLKGLTVHTERYNDTIVLVGEPHLVQMATSFLTQLDIRRRQVAVNVKVVDVQLNDGVSFGSSFSFGIDNTGVVQDGGTGIINFGTSNQNVDPYEWRTDGSGNLIPAYDEQIEITEDFADNLANDITNSLSEQTGSNLSDSLTQNFTDTINRTLSRFGNTSSFSRNQIETLQRSLQEALTRTITESNVSGLTRGIIDNVGRSVTRSLQGLPLGTPNSGQITPFGTNYNPNQPQTAAGLRPGTNFNVPQAFLAQIRANITSGNAKILTDPTLVVQEGQLGSVELVENVVTSVETSVDTESGTRTVTPVIQPAGLTLNVSVEKIDDNGYISLSVNPNISAPGTPQVFDSGAGAQNVITPLVERTVSSGLVRLRDGQTLILSGIIQDGERVQTSKVPILGDLPIIGSLFRSTFKDRTRSEVIVMLTPQILNDSEGYSGFGYNYTPSRETGEYLRDRGLTVPTTPY